MSMRRSHKVTEYLAPTWSTRPCLGRQVAGSDREQPERPEAAAEQACLNVKDHCRPGHANSARR